VYKPQYIIDLIAANTKNTGNPLGIPNSEVNVWWKGVNIDIKEGKERKRDVMLFTGLLYQLSPYIAKIVDHLYKFEETAVEKLIWTTKITKIPKIAKILPKTLVKAFLSVSKEERDYYNGIVRKIADILVKFGVNFCYRPEIDNYSGILLYELGDDEGFAEHASLVAKALEKEGIKKIITIDPHTTYALKVLYPEYINFDLEVRVYFEMLELSDLNCPIKKPDNIDIMPMPMPITLHDPCYYGRYVEISDIPRKILESLEIEYVDVRNSGKLTSCCGGPIESLTPRLSEAIAKNRIEELKRTKCQIATMCPICLANLRRVSPDPLDIAEIIWRAINGQT